MKYILIKELFRAEKLSANGQIGISGDVQWWPRQLSYPNYVVTNIDSKKFHVYICK
jgi:hypothetical protein